MCTRLTEKKKKKIVRGPVLPALVERGGEGEGAQRRAGAAKISGCGSSLVQRRRRILALREIWWCRCDIFRAAVRVIDEYQMLSNSSLGKVTAPRPQEKNKKTTTTKGGNVDIRIKRYTKGIVCLKLIFYPFTAQTQALVTFSNPCYCSGVSRMERTVASGRPWWPQTKT